MKLHNDQQLEFAKLYYAAQGLTLVTDSNDVHVPNGSVLDEHKALIGHHECCEFFWIGSSIDVEIEYKPIVKALVATKICFKANMTGGN